MRNLIRLEIFWAIIVIAMVLCAAMYGYMVASRTGPAAVLVVGITVNPAFLMSLGFLLLAGAAALKLFQIMMNLA